MTIAQMQALLTELTEEYTVPDNIEIFIVLPSGEHIPMEQSQWSLDVTNTELLIELRNQP